MGCVWRRITFWFFLEHCANFMTLSQCHGQVRTIKVYFHFFPKLTQSRLFWTWIWSAFQYHYQFSRMLIRTLLYQKYASQRQWKWWIFFLQSDDMHMLNTFWCYLKKDFFRIFQHFFLQYTYFQNFGDKTQNLGNLRSRFIEFIIWRPLSFPVSLLLRNSIFGDFLTPGNFRTKIG